EINDNRDIARLGEPELFWGVSAGCMDSMVANYTATKKKRKQDDLTPGEENNRRPDRAVIYYSNLIRRYFKNTKPLVLGGMEASLRRIAHYDYWDNSIRRSVLVDAKADLLVCGMAEKTIVELAGKLKNSQDYRDIRGLCYLAKEPRLEYLQLPSYEEAKNDKIIFIDMFNKFYRNNDPLTARGLCQQQNTQYLIQNPPALNPTTEELDKIYELDYQLDIHPYYKRQGNVRALPTIQFSITSQRGCFGECNFCSIPAHQGRAVISRSEKSILKEAEKFTKHKYFKGNISDVGGATANLYGSECAIMPSVGTCPDKKCLFPLVCSNLKPGHAKMITLLQKIFAIKGVDRVFIASGLRYDMIIEDKQYGSEFLKEVLEKHTSGQIKIAPEHTEGYILKLMGKQGKDYLHKFKLMFEQLKQETGKNQFLTYYFIAAHPGCTQRDMEKMSEFISKNLKINPEQIQIFTPLPSTLSALMYYTEMDPFTGENIFVEKEIRNKEKQKEAVTGPVHLPARGAPRSPAHHKKSKPRKNQRFYHS
ncbi:MAG: YgiQ family radical SAM protein, partial [Elusimicrobia bacterium RIFOXYB2_FULL_48_7]